MYCYHERVTRYSLEVKKNGKRKENSNYILARMYGFLMPPLMAIYLVGNVCRIVCSDVTAVNPVQFMMQ